MKKKIVQGLLRAVGRIKLERLYRLADFMAFLLEKVLKYRKAVIMDNLRNSFPDKSQEELEVIAKDFYRHFGEILVETIWFGACDFERCHNQHIVEIVNPEELDKAYAGAPSTVIMSAHTGNWELSGGILSFNYTGTPTCVTEKNYVVTYKKLSSELWDGIMKDNRVAILDDPEGFPGYLETRNVMRYAVKYRSEHKFYNFITDQSPYMVSAGYVDLMFMHQKTRCMSGAAELAHKMGYAVIYLSYQRIARGRYTWEYKTICEDASKMDVEQIVKTYYALLQQDIEKDPANYLWSHRRWKIKLD